ncbi:MAG: GspH/FimT family pseudopilin [Deltaproteobacteria bacterium]|nr:GspH/FimT family pseudopilin [Deltaproteobacteria bacterium]
MDLGSITREVRRRLFLRIFSKERREKGVTLIELAVVMAIVAIMGLFLAPAIGEWVDNFRIRQAARDIASTLQMAKMQTISTRQPHAVNFTLTDGTYGITPLSPGESNSQVPKGVTIKAGSANSISFNPDGTSPVNGTITINNAKGKQYQVSVLATGRIQIQD